MQTIITPTNFSDVSLHAVNYAADMAKALNAGLLVLHATESYFNCSEVYSEPKHDEIEIENKLSKLRNDLIKRTANKISVRSKQVFGLIENEIIKMCNYQNPLAVVMATQGVSFKNHLFIESITVYLSKNLEYPVIVVPGKVDYKPINKILLATDLENLYATLLDRDIDRRNFSKKILALGILDETNEFAKAEGKGRPGKIYQFNKKRYQELVKEGINFEI